MKRKGKNNSRILTILILLLLVVIVIFFMLPGENTAQSHSLDGNWKFYFTYSNDTSLVYRGDLNITTHDSVMMNFEIIAPKSVRAEQIVARNINQTDNTISGTLIYDRFKIRGGYLTENFNLTFKGDSVFDGVGKCMEYCAEGTENASIIWHGSKHAN